MGGVITHSQNLIFWGAGATRALGIRATADQEKFIHCIATAQDSSKPLRDRIAEALGVSVAKRWHDALFDLITILGDGDDAYASIDNVDDEQVEAMIEELKQVLIEKRKGTI